MGRKASKQKSVLIILIATGLTGWQKRNGIFRYIGEGRPWDIRLVSTLDELNDLSRKDITFDGAIVSAADSEAYVAKSLPRDLPMVLFNINLPPSSPLLTRPTGKIFIHHDSYAIGETAANYLLSSGRIRSFAYLDTDEPAVWSDQRYSTFAKIIEKTGFPAHRLSSGDSQEGLAADLAALPRPIGLLVATDRLALLAYSACRKVGLSIPEDIAILGVDDDVTICESVRPSLSSVRTNPESVGYIAAKLLDDLMSAPRRKSRSVSLKNKPVVTVRESTIEGNPHGRTVERALSYISAHATDGIGANDIAHHLGISRRTLDARFREMTGSTVLAHIQSQRLDAVKKLLAETTDTIESITGQCGFGSANHLKKIFKRTFGCSMREWRLSH